MNMYYSIIASVTTVLMLMLLQVDMHNFMKT